MAHLLEVGTGFRSGNSEDPRPGEPRPCYDPAITTLTERRWAKVAELAAMDRQEARLLGLDRVGYRTLIRWERGRERSGLIGCADDRWLRPGGRRPSIGPEIREAIFAVHAELQGRSRVGMATRTRLIHQYVRETYGPDLHVPSYNTLRQVWHEWFGPSGARPRNLGAADLPVRSGHVLVDRPGQVVALDTTVLPAMVREGVFGEPVRAHLTLALDVFTHSLCAFRLTLVSDTAVDAAMMLRDVMLPLPMRPEWGPEMEWPYPGLPACLPACSAITASNVDIPAWRPRASPSSPESRTKTSTPTSAAPSSKAGRVASMPRSAAPAITKAAHPPAAKPSSKQPSRFRENCLSLWGPTAHEKWETLAG
ncbi:hypothetical protein [Streptomyces sp. SID14515]|uniref:hypothetical protein n=1 Tax=Streptomyces sp. SID14515 TaxID=2706074 RepID=UPI0013CB9920|nr:hypothetical protein [Streptomyces sp. SID14515]NEB40128.1 hypothetical protein [Streptomyces sp. SID14515]